MSERKSNKKTPVTRMKQRLFYPKYENNENLYKYLILFVLLQYWVCVQPSNLILYNKILKGQTYSNNI
jgi:hypothetical protein